MDHNFLTMKKATILIVLLFSSLQILQAQEYTWNTKWPDTLDASNICFGVTLHHWIICTSEGMYLYNISTEEIDFYTYGLPIHEAVYLNEDNFLVVMGDGSWSDGIYTFNLNTFEFMVVEWFPLPTFLTIHQPTEVYYAGSQFGGLYTSPDGWTWTLVPYFEGKSCTTFDQYGDNMVISEVSNIYNIHWSDDNGNTWNQAPAGSPMITDLCFTPQGKLYGIFPDYSNSSGLWSSMDYGDSWDVEFFSDNMSTAGSDAFGNVLVGWESPTAGNEGLAIYDPVSVPPNLTFLNEGLPNTNINKILINPTMSAPAIFVCTDGGVYYSYDYMVNVKESKSQNVNIEVYPNPVHSSGWLTFKLPFNESNIIIQLITNKGEIIPTYHETDSELLLSLIRYKIPDLKPGIYYCILSNGTKVWTIKIIVN